MEITPFERIKQVDEQGNEFWSARDLSPMLGYSQWRNFKNALDKAKIACENSGQQVADHFADTSKMIKTGKGAERSFEDYHLSRYACYLIVQNADPGKPTVAAGQTYFAVQTQRMEEVDELAGLTEARKRILLRDKLAQENTNLASVARSAGVLLPQDFAVFQNHGYKGLYGGLSAADIARRKGLKKGSNILDHMNSPELAANLFKSTLAGDVIKQKGVTNKEEANKTHFEVGEIVRNTIESAGGILPENQPTPGQSVKKLNPDQTNMFEDKDL